jgi:hypothetical protein
MSHQQVSQLKLLRIEVNGLTVLFHRMTSEVEFYLIDAQHGRLIPAALSRGIGSDSQRPFAIVIVGGLMADLLMCIFILPTLYVLIARNDDVLPVPDASLEV